MCHELDGVGVRMERRDVPRGLADIRDRESPVLACRRKIPAVSGECE